MAPYHACGDGSTAGVEGVVESRGLGLGEKVNYLKEISEDLFFCTQWERHENADEKFWQNSLGFENHRNKRFL